MLSDYIEEHYGTIIREYEEKLQKSQEQNQKIRKEKLLYQEQHQKDQEQIKKYKAFIKENGLEFE